ncbi:hypothetical protein Dimus_008742 [Dionaea muscipula]
MLEFHFPPRMLEFLPPPCSNTGTRISSSSQMLEHWSSNFIILPDARSVLRNRVRRATMIEARLGSVGLRLGGCGEGSDGSCWWPMWWWLMVTLPLPPQRLHLLPPQRRSRLG